MAAVRVHDLKTSFQRRYPFALDEFQVAAIEELEKSRSVLVAAPTGTGKTLIAEYAVYRALAAGQRVFYTTPIKALSNQKYRDFGAQYGAATGLLTGDVVIYPSAGATVRSESGEVVVSDRSPDRSGHRLPGGQIIVMTTEVLRNMLLQEPEALDDVGCVVFDEVHYLADPSRGTTWEEAIVCCPKHVQLICLSATVANAAEIADWISAVHSRTSLVFHEDRAVPLEHYYFLDGSLALAVDAGGRRVSRFRGVGGEARHGVRTSAHDWIDGPARKPRREPAPEEVVLALRRASLLPAIYFLFSRREAEAAAEAAARIRLAHGPTRQRIAAVVEERLSHLAPEDRALGQVKLLSRLLPVGVGFHHAGMLPVLKVLVEELFNAGLLGVVFATDTLSLGINMPARTVVVGGFTKFDGESRRLLTPNEYRQLAGRAGRRGIDDIGTAVVPYSPWVQAEEAFEIATGPLQPVESAFLVRYNTVLNLWAAAGELETGERIVRLLSSSLREYQLDGQLRTLRAEASRLEERAERASLDCPTCTAEGLEEYEVLRRSLPRARKEQERAERAEADLLAQLEARTWHPGKAVARRALREFVGGEPLHVGGQGWGLFLSRPVVADGAIALVLLGLSARLLRTYAEIDYLPDGDDRVRLPEALVGLASEVTDVRTLLAGEQVARLQADLAALPLPDVEALAAAEREARRAELGPRLAEVGRAVAEARARRRDLEGRIAAHPSHGCPDRRQHLDALRQLDRAREERAELLETIDRLADVRRNRTRQVLRSIQRVLERFGYLRSGHVSAKGGTLRDVFDPNGLIICEALDRGLLDACQPEELAEVLSWFAYDRDVSFPNRHGLPRRVQDLRQRLEEVEAEVLRAESAAGLRLSTGFSRVFYGIALSWCQGVDFDEVLSRISLAEGDVMLTFNKTLDLMRQLRDMLRRNAPTHPLLGRLAAAEVLMRRGIVEQCCRLVASPESSA